MGFGGVVVWGVAVKDIGEDESGRAIANNDGIDVGWKMPDGHSMVGQCLDLMEKEFRSRIDIV